MNIRTRLDRLERQMPSTAGSWGISIHDIIDGDMTEADAAQRAAVGQGWRVGDSPCVILACRPMDGTE